MTRCTLRLVFVILALLLFHPDRCVAQLPYVETDIPMRDGKFLKADIYHNTGWTVRPVILVQTPYNLSLIHI